MCQEILSTILGAGFVGSALLNLWVIRENRRLNEENRIFSIIQSQFNNLYAPLYTLVLQNEDTITLYKKYLREYGIRFIDKSWSDDPETKKHIKEESQNLLDTANKLINNYVVSNNERIIALVKDNAGCVDTDDIEIFNKFEEHYKRLKVEFDLSGKLIIPFEIYNNIGDVSYLLPEFVQRVKEKHKQKVEKLKSLTLKNKDK